MEQLTLILIITADRDAETPVDALLNRYIGRQRCRHCRRRLHAFAERLLCVNPSCSGGAQ
jgi:hypothetical protein